MINLIYNDNAAVLHYLTIEKALRQRINNVLDDGILIEGLRYYPAGGDNDFLEYLLEGDRLKKLVVLRPEKMEKAIRILTGKFRDLTDATSKLYYIVYNIFIKSIYNISAQFDKLNFIEKIAVDTCPYCNRSYIYYLTKDKKIKPELDHFYPKDIYPYFGISFYNLIPSCETCNGLSAKSNEDPVTEGLTNPYLIKPDDFEFNYEPVTGRILSNVLDKKSIKIVMTKSRPGHLKVFKLDELYKFHTDHVLELIIKSKIKYADTYREYLKRYAYKGLVLSDHEIDRMILGNYVKSDETHLRPLAKLYQDIGKELGLIK